MSQSPPGSLPVIDLSPCRGPLNPQPGELAGSDGDRASPPQAGSPTGAASPALRSRSKRSRTYDFFRTRPRGEAQVRHASCCAGVLPHVPLSPRCRVPSVRAPGLDLHLLCMLDADHTCCVPGVTGHLRHVYQPALFTAIRPAFASTFARRRRTMPECSAPSRVHARRAAAAPPLTGPAPSGVWYLAGDGQTDASGGGSGLRMAPREQSGTNLPESPRACESAQHGRPQQSRAFGRRRSRRRDTSDNGMTLDYTAF